MISEALRGSINDKISAGIYVASHFIVLGIIALLTGQPFIFPSLGPSAYLMATGETKRAAGGYHVIGGHFVAVITGSIAYHPIADGLVATEELGEAGRFAPEIFQLAASSTVAMVLCTVGMLAAKTNHPAACATTLIVALGLLTGPLNITIIMGSVVILYVLHEKVLYPGAKRLGLEPDDPRPVDDDDKDP
ncbi:HPP family protein [Halalkalicoccus tibetensis]|uniref:HPP family protein n=1 Tax=Halalkalicoccus tibetensis TaxID=175632 RepID=A0ABD5V1E6_9EURY